MWEKLPSTRCWTVSLYRRTLAFYLFFEVWGSFIGHYRPLEGIQDLPRDQVETIKAPREKKRFDWTASKTKCVAFLHLCRRVPHIYAGIGYTWILTPAQKRVGFYWDLSSSHGRWIGKNSAFPVKGSLRRYCRYWINYFSSGGNKWVRPCQSHRKITVWIWRPAHLLDRLALGQSCVRPFSRLDIAIILNVYCCTVFDWVMQTVTLKHMTAVSLMFTFCATIIFFSTNISTATAFNCFSPRKCWRRAWWEIPTVYKPSQSVAKNL